MNIKTELLNFLNNAVEKFENKEESYQSTLIDGLSISISFDDGKVELLIKENINIIIEHHTYDFKKDSWYYHIRRILLETFGYEG